MSTVLLDIPAETKDWPDWLERQLVGLRLGELIAQLKLLVENSPSPSPSLEQVCGGKFDAVIRDGLKVLSTKEIGQLMKHPDLLLDLQEKVFVSGSRYWDSIPITKEHQDFADQQVTAVLAKIREQGNLAGSAKTDVVTAPPVDNRSFPVTDLSVAKPEETSAASTKSVSRRVWVALATAAVLLFVVREFWPVPKSNPWGFNKSDVALTQLKDGAYLNFLAELCGEWYNKVPQKLPDLSTRLAQFKRGCDNLSQAPHLQLSDPTQREWLSSECVKTSLSIEQLQREISSGEKPLETALAQANKIIDDLQTNLRNQAAKISNA